MLSLISVGFLVETETHTMQVSEGTNAMFAEPTSVQTKETPATLDPRILERTEMTEILEHV